MLRIIFGFLVAALLFPAFLLLKNEREMALYVSVVTISVTIFVAVPALALLMKKHWLTWWLPSLFWALTIGTLGGLAFAFAWNVTFGAGAANQQEVLSNTMLAALFGAAHSLLFWVTGLWGNTALINRQS